jgi:hypothetical protein
MAQVAKALPSATPQNVGVNRPTAYTRGTNRPAAPAFVPVEELNATVGVASYGDSSIFQEQGRGSAGNDEASQPREERPFTAPSQLFANMMEEGQTSGERRVSGNSRGSSPAIVTQAISAYEASARINTGVAAPRGESFNTNF